ncbi:ArdC family protein [Schleiferilactobacillus harbinensis]|jgi:hypothetical protein|uniref:ArdC family protein n=1 Tax=Schleiferilactobacillus harbinensis TaxID=304207 RepID=UPI0007B8BB6E|nr:ArdC family protein [Schleiferilactobacillus harbinensis]
MYKKRSAEEIRQEIQEVSEQMVKDVEQYTNSPEQVKEMLDFMARFHTYSFRNQVMVRSQREGAVAVGSFKKFKDLGYSVKKGEKGIKVWAPSSSTIYQYRNGEGKLIAVPAKQADAKIKALAENGQAVKKQLTRFRLVSVFDATQTNMPAKDYPKLYPNRPIDYSTDKLLVNELSDATSVWTREMGVEEVKLGTLVALGRVKDKGQKGVSVSGAGQQLVAIRDDLPESDKIAVRIHEMAHSVLHQDLNDGKTTAVREFQAEMTSYVVSKHFGMDTSENATSYIASWTDNGQALQAMDPKERAHILADVQSTAKAFIDDISAQLERQRDERDLDHSTNFNDQNELDNFIEVYNWNIVRPRARDGWMAVHRDELEEHPQVYFGQIDFADKAGNDYSVDKYYNIDTEQFEYQQMDGDEDNNQAIDAPVIMRDFPLHKVIEQMEQSPEPTQEEIDWLTKQVTERSQAESAPTKEAGDGRFSEFIQAYNQRMEPNNDGWASYDPEGPTYYKLTPEAVAEHPRVYMGPVFVEYPAKSTAERTSSNQFMVDSYYNVETEKSEYEIPKYQLSKRATTGQSIVTRDVPMGEMVEHLTKPIEAAREDMKTEEKFVSKATAELLEKPKPARSTTKKDLAMKKAMAQKGMER